MKTCSNCSSGRQRALPWRLLSLSLLLFPLVFGLCSFALAADGAGGKGGNGKGGQKGKQDGKGGPEIKMPTPAFRTEVPVRSHDIVLGRPARDSITLSVLSFKDGEGFVEYGTASGSYVSKTPLRTLKAGIPAEIALTELKPNTRYFYRWQQRAAGGTFSADPEGTFHTARPAGSTFAFTIQADPHLDYGTDPEIYKASLTNALAAKTDFHIDLGDTFMTDKYTEFHQAAPQYLAQRYYLGLLAAGAPVFLVLGNHDGEMESRDGKGPDSMAVWSNTMRKRYFPNPLPDSFYTGNTQRDPSAGLLQDYYAFEWGDALFVALDPFWYSARQRGRGSDDKVDNWGRTLGEAQYQWLKRTLETSKAKFKFIFLHHLVGGLSREGRGGSGAAPFFEWGGRDIDGRNTFAQHRPGWPAPIHELLMKNHVNAVFHGHDHIYAKQDLDGIVYQEIPQPGHPRPTTRTAEEYGYKSGVIMPGSGILKVTVSPGAAKVDYVKAGAGEPVGGSVAHSYTLNPN